MVSVKLFCKSVKKYPKESTPCLNLWYFKGFSAKVEQAAEEKVVSAGFSGPLDHYSGLIRQGTLREDEHQKSVLQKLDQLHKTLRGYNNAPTSIFSKVQSALLLLHRWLILCIPLSNNYFGSPTSCLYFESQALFKMTVFSKQRRSVLKTPSPFYSPKRGVWKNIALRLRKENFLFKILKIASNSYEILGQNVSPLLSCNSEALQMWSTTTETATTQLVTYYVPQAGPQMEELEE